MFNFSLWDFPNKIKQDVAYILYYTFNVYIPMLLVVTAMSQWGAFPSKLSDYQFFMITLIYSAIVGYLFWLLTTSPEKKAIKRRHFVAGLMQVLSERWKISYIELYKKCSYSVFWSSDITLFWFYWRDYAKTLIVLINLGIIELVNEKDFQKCSELFDFNHFEKNIDKMIFQLKSKKVDLDEITSKVQNYLF